LDFLVVRSGEIELSTKLGCKINDIDVLGNITESNKLFVIGLQVEKCEGLNRILIKNRNAIDSFINYLCMLTVTKRIIICSD
jgi:hypothetical protein